MATPPVLLRPVGFWSVRKDDGLPDPKTLMSPSWEKGRREFIASYLSTCAVLDTGAPHGCVICGASTGGRERTDGVWRWPESLAHFVREHGVRLPQELIDHMAKLGFDAPKVDVGALLEALPPSTNPAATSLISKGAVAVVLDEMLDDKMPGPAAPARAPGKGESTRSSKSSPSSKKAVNEALDDETQALPVAQSWKAMVQGVPTQPQKIVFDRPVVLGRDRTCDVVLDHQSVSRRHARLVPSNDGVIVQDLGSSNGVWVQNKRREGQIAIGDGGQFSLGQATITIVRER